MPRLTTRDYKRPSRGTSASKLREFGLGVLVGAVLASAAFLVAGAHARHRAAAIAREHAAPGTTGAAPPAPAPGDSASSGAGSAVTPVTAARSVKSASAHPGAQAPQYDFYRMLPRLNVPVPHDDAHASHAPPPPASPVVRSASAAGPSYYLQVGSYRSSAEADAVRARLARAGISARVERVAEGSGTWNRVRIGPLSDPQLTRVRQQLRSDDIHVLLIRAGR